MHLHIVDDQPDDRESGGRPRCARDAVRRQRHPVAPLDEDERRQREDGELAVEIGDRQHGAKRQRAAAQFPENEDVDERLDAGARQFEEMVCRRWRRNHKRQSCDEGERWSQSQRISQRGDERDGCDCVQRQEGEPHDGDRRPRDPEKRSDDPRFDGEQVVQAVIEKRKFAETAEASRHQSDDGLIGIEEKPLV